MRVLYLKTENVAGIRELEVAPGKLTEIVGDNGTGKSSMLKIIDNALGGRESLARLHRLAPNEAGEWLPVAEPPRIVMLIGEPGQPHRYELDKDEKGVTLKERVGDSRGFKTVKKPQTVLESFYDGRASNPVPFIRLAELGREKELANLILEALPLPHDEKRMAEILGDRAHLVKGRDMLAKLHPIEEIYLTREAIFEARHGVNGKETAKRLTAEDLLKSIPAFEDRDTLTAKISAAKAEHAEKKDLATALKFEIDQAEKDRAAAANRAFETAKDSATAARAAARKAAEEAYTAAIRAADADHDTAMRTAKQNLTDAQLAAAREREVEREALESAAYLQNQAAIALHLLEEEAEKMAESAILEKRADQARAEADELLAESKKLTEILNRLDDFARSLADEIPIPGLVIKPGKITLNGIPIHQQNTAELAKFAVRVSILRTAGTLLPWVIVDGMEMLGVKAFIALKKELEAVPDIQIFMARVAENSVVEIKSGGEIVGEAKL